MPEPSLAIPLSRRALLRNAALGLGALGAGSIFDRFGLEGAEAPAKAGQRPHHPPKAKSLIWIIWGGGPSQFESFTWKPGLAKNDGKSADFGAGLRGGTKTLTAPQVAFKQYGKSGLWISELFPRFAGIADDLCMIESMKGDDAGHSGAHRQTNTGFVRKPMPGLGSWIVHGLGSANPDLPPYVNLGEGVGTNAFLPAATQGVPLSLNQKAPTEQAMGTARRLLDMVGDLNRGHGVGYDAEDVLSARTAAGELAYRMMKSGPEALDISKEGSAIRALYGLDEPAIDRAMADGALNLGGSTSPSGYGERCLIARRLVERGVRVVTFSLGGARGWDHHNKVKAGTAYNARLVDRPVAGLIADLKQRGLLDTTMVVIGGEFGRSPFVQGSMGREHYARAYTWVVAGGGFKKGIVYGQSDEIGNEVVGDQVHITDMHATMLWQLGLDHQRLSYRHGSTDMKPGETFTKVHRGLLA